MKTNKIAIIEPVGGHGGMDYYDYGLAYGLAKSGLEVQLYTCSKTVQQRYSGVTSFFTFKNFWDKPLPIKLFLFFAYYLKTILLIKKHRCDLVHIHYFSFSLQNFIALLLLKLFGLKVILTLHDVDSFHGQSAEFIGKISYKLLQGMIVHNKTSYNSLLAKQFSLPPVSIIPHGNYKPFVDLLPPPGKKETISLLFFGHIKEVKGLDILLYAFAKIVETNDMFRLIIAGKPWKTELNKYQQLIEELHLEEKVETHFSYIDNDEVSSFYKRADLLVLPYRRIYQSGVLLMAMSMGRTVIASDLPAFKWIIRDGENGFLFESENVDSLVQSLLSLSHEKIVNATQNCSKTMDEDFDWKHIGKKTMDFYNSL